MKKFTLPVLVAAFVGSSVFAQDMPMRDPEGGMFRGQMLERLKLSDDQHNQIEKLRTEFQKQQIGQRAKVQTARVELRQLMRADNPDKAAIEKKINEVSQLGAQLQVTRVNRLLAVRKILTPEQQKMIREGVRERMQQGFMGPRQRMQGFMGPRFGKRFEGGMNRFGPGFRQHRPF